MNPPNYMHVVFISLFILHIFTLFQWVGGGGGGGGGGGSLYDQKFIIL